KAIQRELAGTGKKLTLELGGKAANIIFDDCALDQAVEGIVNGIYFNQGHVCCAGSRLLVQEPIYEPLIEKLRRRLTTLRGGDPVDQHTDVGAIHSRQQRAQLEAGGIWADTYNRFDPASPFGGYKESGFGREGGRHGLEPYLAFDGAESTGG